MVYMSLACRALLGLVFLAAVVAKLRNGAQIRSFVAATGRLAPRSLTGRVPAGVLAGAVASAEVAAVVLLAVPATAAWGFAVAGGLALVLAAAIVAALRRGERGSCNCFGATQRPVSASHVVRNLLLAAGAGLGIGTTQAGQGGAEPALALLAVVAGGVVALLLIIADDIAALFRPLDPSGRRPTG